MQVLVIFIVLLLSWESWGSLICLLYQPGSQKYAWCFFYTEKKLVIQEMTELRSLKWESVTSLRLRAESCNHCLKLKGRKDPGSPSRSWGDQQSLWQHRIPGRDSSCHRQCLKQKRVAETLRLLPFCPNIFLQYPPPALAELMRKIEGKGSWEK